MTQKVTVELEGDLVGGPAGETVRFAIEGTEYEVELSAKNAAAFRTLRALYRARPHCRAGAGPRGRANRGQPTALGTHSLAGRSGRHRMRLAL
jgi:hypothetical protein